MLYVITRSVRFAALGGADQKIANASRTNKAIRVGINATRILTWALYASLPLARHVLRRVLSGRNQRHCRGWNAGHLPGTHLARSRSESRKRHQHRRVVARTVWRSVRLSQRAREQLDHTHTPRRYERRWRRVRR